MRRSGRKLPGDDLRQADALQGSGWVAARQACIAQPVDPVGAKVNDHWDVLVVLRGRGGSKSERKRVSKTVRECVQNSAVDSVWEE